uniref:Major facilitator superfamily (MFS) profile domain-containing protein n=1 Tax=Strigamia maritima TaxID=126957 RepID=T1JKC7_STRMM
MDAGRRLSCPDGGYGWLVAVSAAAIAGLANMVYKCMGQIYVSMLQSTNYSRSQLAPVLVLPGVLASAIGLSLSSFSTHNLAVFTLTFIILAMGFVTSLAGTITFLTPLMIQWFLDEYHLNGALLLWGGVMFHGCIAALLVRQPTWALRRKSTMQVFLEEEFESHPSLFVNIYKFLKLILTQLSRDCRHFRRLTFILLLFNRVTFFIAKIGVNLMLPQFAMDHIEGITSTETAILLSVFNVGDVISKLLGAQKNCIFNFIPRHSDHCVNDSVCPIVFFALVVSVLNGLFSGFAFVTYFLIVFDTFGPTDSPGVIALHVGITGISLISIGPMTAWIQNVTGSNKHCFTYFSFLLVVSVLLWSCYPVISYFKKKKSQSIEDQSTDIELNTTYCNLLTSNVI